MGYRNSALYRPKYVAEMLDEAEEFLRDCSIEMFSEDSCLSAYDDYPASEFSETIVVFTEDGIENSSAYCPPQRTIAPNRKPRPRVHGTARCLPWNWNACPALMAPAA
ncbi:hypothetical protein NLY43_13055 [Mesorhizobium sp. C416B]|uniref:hypothetical protein n=1 Tax=unclassified Mesorhizobium TaxID=325217 RepID=UPI0004CDE8EE|nr:MULTISPECIES: hypothetical protein [unclassified Mesorhizobium]WJI65554.1 hypothetical protein NLY43_13055 [Mesorhizobium sp. C416B]